MVHRRAHDTCTKCNLVTEILEYGGFVFVLCRVDVVGSVAQ